MKNIFLFFVIINIKFISLVAFQNQPESELLKFCFKLENNQKKLIVNCLVAKYAYCSIIKHLGYETKELEKLREYWVKNLKKIKYCAIINHIEDLVEDELIDFAETIYKFIPLQYIVIWGSKLLKPEKYIII